MSGRRQVLVEGNPTEVMAGLMRFFHTTGCSDIEVRYDVLDQAGEPTEQDLPGPDDTVRWTATVTYPRRRKIPKREISATYDAGPGSRPDLGMVSAATALVEKLGGNVVLIDMADRSAPRGH